MLQQFSNWRVAYNLRGDMSHLAPIKSLVRRAELKLYLIVAIYGDCFGCKFQFRN